MTVISFSDDSAVVFALYMFILGCVSYRHPARGTRYVRTVVNVFMNEAQESHIEAMLDKVTFSDIGPTKLCFRKDDRAMP